MGICEVFFSVVLLKDFILSFEIKVSNENFDGILKELGIGKVLRTLAKTMKPHLTISENNGVWTFKSETTFKTTAYTFTPGEKFEDEGHDGEKYTV